MNEPQIVDLVGVGLNSTDTLVCVDTYPERGSKVAYSCATVMPGGQTATTVIACQRWGMSTRYVGKLGEDDAARRHREAFAGAGVDARLVTLPKGESAQSLILVDAGGERTVMGRRDERIALRPEELNRDWIVRARILHTEGFDTLADTLAARWARAEGIPVVADLDETYPGVDALLENVDYLIVSRDFPARLVREPDLELALRRMMERYGCKLTAATLGEDGVLAWDGHSFCRRPAYRVPVADTTGAGDIFHAGFIYGMHKGWPLERQLDFACAAAALNCAAMGARGGIESLEAIERLMAEAPRYKMEKASVTP